MYFADMVTLGGINQCPQQWSHRTSEGDREVKKVSCHLQIFTIAKINSTGGVPAMQEITFKEDGGWGWAGERASTLKKNGVRKWKKVARNCCKCSKCIK